MYITIILDLKQAAAFTEKINLNIQEHSFQIYGAKFWNKIPASLAEKQDYTKSTFSRNLNSHLFTILLGQDNYILTTKDLN